MINNFSIENFLNLTNYVTDVRKKRRKEGKFGGGTQEFFTPYSIVKRMCDKVDDDTWSDPSKTFLESGFGNGQYDVKDFLKLMEKKEVEKKTGIKRFSVCLMNPPYGSKEQKNNRIHYKFVTKCNEISNLNVVVMPYKMIDATSNQYDDIKNEYDNILTNVEEVDASVFDIHVGSVGIYTFNNLKGNNNHIAIHQKNGNVQTVKSLFEFNSRNINEYEQNILNYLDNHGNTNYYMIGSGSKHYRDKDLLLKSYKKKFNDDDILLLTNYSHGSGRPFVFMSPNTGQIFKAGEVENCEYAMKGYRSVLSKFKTFNEANNFKDALKRPLMRFGLSKLQDSQDMPKRVRQYIPDIDWSDDKAKTDEGILELCGCPKDKCKEYAEYCKKIINEFDKKYDNKL